MTERLDPVYRFFKQRVLSERFFPLMVFVLLAVFTYQKFFLAPYAGFEFYRGKITEVYVTGAGRDSLQVGDQITKIGATTWDEFDNDLRRRFFEGAIPGQVIPILVERDGQILSLDWIYPGPTSAQILERLNSQWWLVYVFWLAGTATLLFIRPKDGTWFLLSALNYLTALWLAAGSGPSHWHLGESAIVLRAAIWLCVPVYLHFHWVFPKPFVRLPIYILGALYVAGGGLALAEWLQIITPFAFLWGFLLAIGGSILIIAAHFILQPAYRRDVLILVMGAALALLPLFFISGVILLGIQPSSFTMGGLILALPALPGAYFFTVYRQQLGRQVRRARRLVNLYISAVVLGALLILLFSLLSTWPAFQHSTLAIGAVSILLAGIIAITSFFPFLALPALSEASPSGANQSTQLILRANRLISFYLFFIFIGIVYAIAIALFDNWLKFPGHTLVVGSAAALSAGILTLVCFAPFQRFVDHRLLNLPLPPTHLIETYSERITTCLDTPSLICLLRDEILPSLLVRQSALLRFDEEKNAVILYAAGVNAEQLPAGVDLSSLLAYSSGSQPSVKTKEDPIPLSWVQVVLPMEFGEKLIGLWFLGSRDPDDTYARSEISILKSIANQSSIALVNIAQSERLHTLYQADIERQEKERSSLARGLHDDVLNQLASLALHTENLSSAPGFEENFQSISTYLRGVISDLRPAMLAYGLWLALEALVDQLPDRAIGDPKIRLDIPTTEVRYGPKVEQHVYRIVQQALENAVRHAHARNIHLHGNLDPERLELVVEDDGVGFSTFDPHDLSQLLSEGHYGLVGMHERAALIEAGLKIDSAPGKGTRVTLNWSSEKGCP